MSLFNELYYRNVNEHTQKVQGLTYLSWSYAWAEIKKVDEKASVTIHEFPMLDKDFRVVEGITVPYLKTPEGYFVKVSVTINGHTETEMLPVMDNKNVPLGTIAPVWVKKEGATKAVKDFGPTPQPTSFDINSSHKRCMVKAIALHGLGLYIYNGEDVPEVDEAAIQKQKEADEKNRQNFISMTKELSNQRPELAAKLSEIEHKMKKPIEKFDLKAAERAYMVISNLVNELEHVQ